MRAPGPGFAPPLQSGLPGAAPLGQHPPPPYPPPLPPGAFPPMPPMYMPGGYGAYGAMIGAAPYWQPPSQLSFAPPPPPSVGDWRAPPPGAYPAVMPIDVGVGGGAMPVGLAGLAAAPPVGHPPMGAAERPQPGPLPSSEARRAQLAQLEDGDLPSSAAALQRRLEDLQLGREAAAGEAAGSFPRHYQRESPDDDLNGAALAAGSGPSTSGGTLAAGTMEEQPRLSDVGDGGGGSQQGEEPGSLPSGSAELAGNGAGGNGVSRLDSRSLGVVSNSGAEGAHSLTHSTNGGPPAEGHACSEDVSPSSLDSPSARSPLS
ncbi:hypothetical protein MMPV_008177 [Pyropia vietnamensis]